MCLITELAAWGVIPVKDVAYRRAMRRMDLWLAAYMEAIKREAFFAITGRGGLAHQWRACARRRAAFVVSAQAEAIAFASR
jgi:hypothetical protein